MMTQEIPSTVGTILFTTRDLIQARRRGEWVTLLAGSDMAYFRTEYERYLGYAHDPVRLILSGRVVRQD